MQTTKDRDGRLVGIESFSLRQRFRSLSVTEIESKGYIKRFLYYAIE